MNREAIGTGKTVEEALEQAYAQLGVDGDNSEFEIIERPKRSFFGLKVTPAKVKVTVELPDAKPSAIKQRAQQTPAKRPVMRQPQTVTTQQKPPVSAEKAEEAKKTHTERPERPEVPKGTVATGEKVDAAVAYLTEIFKNMELGTVDIKAFATPEGAVLTLTGEGLGVLIGRRGETLDALQYLSGLVANRMEGEYFRITIDSGNYREKRERTLEQLAKKLSSQVIKNGRSMTLEPMNPYERRIIHATVQNIVGVTSSSTGEEPNRKVVISSTSRKEAPARDGGEPRPARRPYENRGNAKNGAAQRSSRPNDGKPHEFRRNTNTASDVVTRPGAFNESMKAAAQSPKKRIDDSQFDIAPPTRTVPLTAKPEAPKPASAVVVPEKPLYSKIEID
ncbi:MAG: RNA-binding cell elongation regulator Jag/EloR [Hydrogenoanaerobacterium sp.]